MECFGQKVTLNIENKKSHEVCTIDYSTESEDDCEDDEIIDESTDDVNVGDWLIMMYDGKMYPGRVTANSEIESKKVSVMRSEFPTRWKWMKSIMKMRISRKKSPIPLL